MVQERFCQCQVYAKGDSKKAYSCKPEDPKAQLFCTAHLCESSAYPCPYNPSEIYNQNGIFRIAHKNQEGNLVSRCEDFEPIQSQETSAPKEDYQEPPQTHYSGSSKTRRPKSQTSSKSPKLAFIIKSFKLPCPVPKACRMR